MDTLCITAAMTHPRDLWAISFRCISPRSFSCSGSNRSGVACSAVALLLAFGCSSDDSPETAAPGAGGQPTASAGASGSAGMNAAGASSAGEGGAPPGVSSGGSEGLPTPTLDDGKAGAGNGTGGSPTGPTPASLIPGTENYDCSPPSGTIPPLELVPVVTGLNNPIYVTHAPGETDRMFVLEQAGTIQVVRDGAVAATPFLDLTASVGLLTWEQGLLGLAFHPRYAENGLFYVHYNGADGSAVIAEFNVSADADVADPASERILLTVATGDGYHNGGSINFGPDGFLYIGLGDGGGLGADVAQTSRANAQDVASLRGAMLRIDPVAVGDDLYTVPAGNLIDVNPAAAPEVWSKGLRNPYRSNFDPCTGALYIGDVGDRSWEEVNVEPPATGHRNYGWPILEGDECFQATGAPGGPGAPPGAPVAADAGAGGCDRTGLTPPVHTHPSANTGGPQFQAVIGGSVYRGSAIPALRGTYFFTDLYGNTRTFTYDVASDTISDIVSLETDLNPAENDQGLVAIQTGGDGELYFVSRGSSGGGGEFQAQDPIGTIYRLQAE